MTTSTGVGRGNHNPTGGRLNSNSVWSVNKLQLPGLMKAYIEGGHWRCGAPLTTAHHWKIDEKNIGTCLHCGRVKQFERARW